MSVYKPTYCYPFLNTVDMRVGLRTGPKQPVEYLKCEVDTSNKNITGYSIRILDADNNVLFPKRTDNFISPISELQSLTNYQAKGTNSGINGTYMEIPFFQNKNDGCVKLNSYNAIYYEPKYLFDHIILDATLYANAGFTGPLPSMEDINNWDFQNDNLYYTTDPMSSITLDGEILISGDVIFVASSQESNKNGLWKVAKGTDGRVILKPLLSIVGDTTNKPVLGEKVVILRGEKFHNTIWEKIAIGYEQKRNETSWYAYDDNDQLVQIDNLNVNGITLKWEITLYQGEGEKQRSSSNLPLYYSYQNISEDWLDMKLTSGKILGSTSKRVQIASDDGSNNNDIYLPEGQNTTLILQTRYMKFGDLNSNNVFDQFTGSSVYVQTYDSVYGHVYPVEGTLDSTQIESHSYVQFFKHSSNSEQILNTDIVDYGFDDTNNKHLIIMPFNTGSTTTSKIYTLADSGDLADYISLYGITVGQTLLLNKVYDNNGTLRPERNGVYSFEGEEELQIQPLPAAKDRCYVFKRASSYSNWSSYIGKVIYCAGGVLQGQNVESLANAGTFTLWNPRSTNTEDSPLLFINEMPILLFPQKLGKDLTFNLFDNVNNRVDPHTEITIDTQSVQVGDLILYKDFLIGKVLTVTSNGYTIQNIDTITVGNELFYVLGGQEFGHRVWKRTNLINPNLELYTAKILKNSAEYTYISPYSGMKKDMKIKLSNNKKVLFEGSVDETEWISVLDYNPLISRIKHKKLDSNSPGIEQHKITGGYGLISYTADNDSSIPWKYEVRSYFRASDENTFYAYEYPYLILMRHGEQYTDLSHVLVYNDLMTADNPPENFFVNNNTQQFSVFYTIEDPSYVKGRSLDLSAKYIQFQQASWESYRWVLFDKDGNMLQDTGKKYNKNLNVSFYGLANDSNEDSFYYAVLYVEDDLGNTLQYAVKFYVSAAETTELQIPFTATFDCATRSTILEYRDFGVPMACYKISENELQVYDSNSKTPSSQLWDDGIKYNTSTLQNSCMHIWNDGNDNPQIDYRWGSTISGKDGKDYLSSKSLMNGVSYSNHFSRYTVDSDISANSALRLSKSENGEFYFDTEITFSKNMCGEFLAINVESYPEAGNRDPYVDISEDQDLQGYLTFALSLPDNFSNINTNTLNNNRNAVGLKIYANRGSQTDEIILPTNNNNGYLFQDAQANIYNWFTLPSAANSLYYLQDDATSTSNDGKEYLHYKFLENNIERYKFWIKSHPSFYFSSKTKFLGNINLIGVDDVDNLSISQNIFNNDTLSADAPSYWVEDRAYLRKINTYSSKFLGSHIWHFSDLAADRIDTTSGTLLWPGDSSQPLVTTDEEDYFWNEKPGSTLANNDCATWDSIDSKTSVSSLGLDKVKSVDRHNSNSHDSKKYRVTMWVTSVAALYNGIVNGTFNISYEKQNSEYYINLKGDGTNNNGRIRLKPLQ